MKRDLQEVSLIFSSNKSWCGDDGWGYFSTDPVFLKMDKISADQPWEGALHSSLQNKTFLSVTWFYLVNPNIWLDFSVDAAAMAGLIPSRVDFSSSSSVFSLLITHSRASRPCQKNTGI